MAWSYTGADAGICLFDACLTAGAPITFTPGMRVLEAGCCESDWLERASAAWPETQFTGVDVRTKDATGRFTLKRGDLRDPDLFAPASFDAVVSLSAMEHIGLGHYGDPTDEDGDITAMANLWRWLTPNGWVYFDVPYDPSKYWLEGTKCRIYDDEARWMRLWQTPLVRSATQARWQWDGYSAANTPGTLVEKPTHPHPRYWYAAMVWAKCEQGEC